jgi:Family of unknown function (DUF5522)
MDDDPPVGGRRDEPLADRPLSQPHESRLPRGHPGRAAILAAHQLAMDGGQPGYSDPDTGLYVLTAAYLAERGTCCDSGCRHCPYLSS